jgi:ADP-heptose:LPS heptosyltransferase
MKIVLSRTDSIGDVVLTLPMAGVLRQHLPDAEIIMLTSRYAAPVAWYCDHLHQVWNWSEVELLPQAEQMRLLEDVDVFVHVFPRQEIAQWASKAGVAERIGTSHRVYHWLTCTKRVSLGRKESDLHEAQLNIALLEPLLGKQVLGKQTIELEEIPHYYGMSSWIQVLSERLQTFLHPTKFNLILHPKSQGSAPEWPVAHYERLLELLPAERFHVIVTGTEQEAEQVEGFMRLAEDWGAVIAAGQTSLDELVTLIANADGLVASSTGPLHIAAALGRNTLGLFAPVRPMHAGRWKPLGVRATTLSLEDECERCGGGTTCSCIAAITPEQVVERLAGWKKI